MAKFFGKIGYALSQKTMPGVWEDGIEERDYVGDVEENSTAWRQNETINPDVVVTGRISIIADGFVLENLHTMRYVHWQGANWSIANIRVERPRVYLTIGGLYSGNQGESQ